MKLQAILVVSLAMACAACVSPDASGEAVDEHTDALLEEAPIAAALPSGSLRAPVVEIDGEADLPATLPAQSLAYIHSRATGAWYFESGDYLLGVDAFLQFHQELDRWVVFGSGGSVAPARARIVAQNVDGAGWNAASVAAGSWPATLDAVWVVGTSTGVLSMYGAPERIPVGTVVVGSMQSYGGILSTPWLFGDDSPRSDAARIGAVVAIDAGTQLGGHSAGSSVARRIAMDLGLTNVFLYGTPNYSRGSGARTVSEGGMVAEVINNTDDPITNCLDTPWNLVSLAWGTANCHDYENWDYETTSSRYVRCH